MLQEWEAAGEGEVVVLQRMVVGNNTSLQVVHQQCGHLIPAQWERDMVRLTARHTHTYTHTPHTHSLRELTSEALPQCTGQIHLALHSSVESLKENIIKEQLQIQYIGTECRVDIS